MEVSKENLERTKVRPIRHAVVLMSYDSDSMRFLNSTSKLVQINVRWMMRDMSNLVDNYRSQIRYTTELWNKGRLIGTSTTSTMAISRKETWCYARLRPCKGVMSGFDFGDIETFDVIFKADEDNRYKGNLAWYRDETKMSYFELLLNCLDK